jgi:hypothetical protein
MNNRETKLGSEGLMKKILNLLMVALVALVLVACGSGGGCDAGSSPLTGASACSGDSGGSTDTTAESIDVLAASPDVGSASSGIVVSAIVKGAGNVALPDTAITFATDTGTLTNASTTTDSSGVATVTLSAGANKSNRTITVTATSGTASGNVQVQVTGTTLSIAGETTVSLGSTATMSVTATDSSGTAIPGLAVTAASSLGNGLSATTLTTNSAGAASVVYTASNAGSDTLTFTGAGVTSTVGVIVSGEDFVFTTPEANTSIEVGTSETITVRYRSGGVPQAGRTVNFAATAGTVTPTSAVTDANGLASASVSSTSASPATLQATLTGAVTAQATLPVEFVAVTPASLVLQVTPSAIGPNTGTSTTQQATLVATVTDANSNPVKDVTVNFNRLADPSGGNLSQASAVTNSSGQASVQYIAGAQTTASNGVKLRATVATATSVVGDAALTVNQSALFIALGTGNVITNLDPQTYQKDWVVYVTDSNGVAVPNVSLTIKALPVSYGKGVLTFNGTVWSRSPSGLTECANEDENFNGTLDADEDANSSDTLEPGNVISVSPGTVTTDSDGRATISLIYAESYAPWVTITLRAEAVVSGTESSKESTFTVPGLAADFSAEDVPPAGATSPFGVNSCAVAN